MENAATNRAELKVANKYAIARSSNENVDAVRVRKELHDRIHESELNQKFHEMELREEMARANKADRIHGIQEKQAHLQGQKAE